MTRRRRSRPAWRSWDWRPAGLLLLVAVAVLIAGGLTGFSYWFFAGYPAAH
jgi:hypothetical protein